MHSSHNTCADRSATATVTVFGCGNPLFGDDGFGPAVIDRLARHPLPETVRLIDAGTGIREHLLDYLLAPAERPGMLIIADACLHRDRAAGELREERPAALTAEKLHDFSLHQFPTVNLLQELERETGIKVILLTAQMASQPEAVRSGFSPEMTAAVDAACDRILRILARQHHETTGS